MTADEPQMIGKGLGTLLADMVPFAPSSARRAGAAELMARRMGDDTPMTLKYPMLSQMLTMTLGGALAGSHARNSADPSIPALTALALGPNIMLQLLKRKQINDIDNRYQETKRKKRLAEIGGERVLDDSLGSKRLGMAQAYEAMRLRKMKDISALSEAGDAVPLATTVMGLGPGASLPITQLIDQIESGKLLKRADFSDQINAPTVALALLAAAGGTAGLQIAGQNLREDLQRQGQMPQIPRWDWENLGKHIAGKPIVSADLKHTNVNNAFFGRPMHGSQEQLNDLMRYALADPINQFRPNLAQKIQDNGLMVFGPRHRSSGIVAHEAGHGKIEHTPGALQAIQRYAYPLSSWAAPLTGVGALAAGLGSGGVLAGLLAGTGVGLLGTGGTLLPELMASKHGLDGLKTFRGGKYYDPSQAKSLAKALGTYGASLLLPSVLAGGLGGWVSGRRKKKRQEEERKKSAAIKSSPEHWNYLWQALQIQNRLGRDAADRFIVPILGSRLSSAMKQFKNRPEIKEMGIKPGTSGAKINSMMKDFVTRQAPSKPLEQMSLDLK